MDYINSDDETNQLFPETDTLYDFFGQEEMWEVPQETTDHHIKHFSHNTTDEDYIDQWFNRHK